MSNNLKRRKNVDKDTLKLLKKVSLIYLDLTGKISEKNKLFDLISAAGKIDLDYEMKMIRNFDYTSVSRISEKISEYFTQSKNGITEIQNMLKGVLNEGFNTAG